MSLVTDFISKYSGSPRRYARASSRWLRVDDYKLRQLAGAKWPVREIAQALCRTEAAIRARAKLLQTRLTRSSRAATPAPGPAEALRLYREKIEFDMPVTINAIIASTAKRHGLTFDDLVSEGRNAHLVAARHEAIWLCCRDTPCSLPKIGRAFHRDHTTILHALRRQNEIRGANVRAAKAIP